MESCYRPISWPMFRRSDGNTSISPENIAGQSLSVGFRPLPQTTPSCPRSTAWASSGVVHPSGRKALIL
ncbi:hypothetical protein BH595_02335, partial [Pseudomonas aeruginosa]